MAIGTISVPHRPPRQDRVTIGSYGTRNYPPAYWREIRRHRDALGTVYQDFRGTQQNAVAIQAKQPFASTFAARAKAVTEDMRKVPLFQRLRNPASSQVPIVRWIVGPEGFSPWFHNINRDPGGKAIRNAITSLPYDHPHNLPGRTPHYPARDPGTKMPEQGFGARYQGEWASGPATGGRHGRL